MTIPKTPFTRYQKNLISKQAMEDYLFEEYSGFRQKTNGGWCIDECHKCRRLTVAPRLWAEARKAEGE